MLARGGGECKKCAGEGEGRGVKSISLCAGEEGCKKYIIVDVCWGGGGPLLCKGMYTGNLITIGKVHEIESVFGQSLRIRIQSLKACTYTSYSILLWDRSCSSNIHAPFMF